MSRSLLRRLTTVLLALAVGLGLAVVPANAAAFTITVNKTSVDITLGNPFTLSGDVSPSWKNQTVYLQINQSGTWKTLAQTSTTDTAGSYSIKYKPQGIGIKQYRMYRPAVGGMTTGVSKTVTAKVYVWRDVYNWTPTDSSHWLRRSSETVGGVTYPRSFKTEITPSSWHNEGNGYGYYNLKGQCSHVRAHFVPVDTSGDSRGRILGQWRVGLYKASTQPTGWSQQFYAGQKEYRTISASGWDEVGFGWSPATYDDHAMDVGVLGTPQARCLF